MDHLSHTHTDFRPSPSKQQSTASWALPNQQSSVSYHGPHTYQNPHQTLTERPMTPPDKRGVIQDSVTTFTIVVDVHDFNPEEISVQIVDNATAAIVKGEHGRPETSYSKNEELSNIMLLNGELHSETRSFSERYSLPPDLNMGTFKWDFPDRAHLRIMAEKVASIGNGQTLQQAIQQRQQQEVNQKQQVNQKSQVYYYPNTGANFVRFVGNNSQLVPNVNGFNRNGFPRYGYNIGNHSGHQRNFRNEFPHF